MEWKIIHFLMNVWICMQIDYTQLHGISQKKHAYVRTIYIPPTIKSTTMGKGNLPTFHRENVSNHHFPHQTTLSLVKDRIA